MLGAGCGAGSGELGRKLFFTTRTRALGTELVKSYNIAPAARGELL